MFKVMHVRKYLWDNKGTVPEAKEALQRIESRQSGTDDFIEGATARFRGEGIVTAGWVEHVLGKEHCDRLGGLYCTDEYQSISSYPNPFQVEKV